MDLPLFPFPLLLYNMNSIVVTSVGEGKWEKSEIAVNKSSLGRKQTLDSSPSWFLIALSSANKLDCFLVSQFLSVILWPLLVCSLILLLQSWSQLVLLYVGLQVHSLTVFTFYSINFWHLFLPMFHSVLLGQCWLDKSIHVDGLQGEVVSSQ